MSCGLSAIGEYLSSLGRFTYRKLVLGLFGGFGIAIPRLDPPSHVHVTFSKGQPGAPVDVG